MKKTILSVALATAVSSTLPVFADSLLSQKLQHLFLLHFSKLS